MQSNNYHEKQEKERLLEADVSISDEDKLNGFLCSGVGAGDDLDRKLLLGNHPESVSSFGDEDDVAFHSSQVVLRDESTDDDLRERKSSGHDNNNETVPYDGCSRENDVCRKNDDCEGNDRSLENGLSRVDQECEVSGESTDLGRLKGIEVNRKDSNNELIVLQSADNAHLTSSGLIEERGVADTSFSEIPTIEDDEGTRLLQSSNGNMPADGEERPGENDADDDADSVVSVFGGSLSLDVLDIPWESDIGRVVDIQRDEADWETRINPVEGGLRVEGWDTKIVEISNEGDGVNDWNTSIHEMLEDQELHAGWGTEIAGQFINEETPVDWSTRFNSIEKVNSTTNVWTTVFRKIRSHVSARNEWTTTFNAIGEDPTDKPAWKFKMPKRMTNLAQSTDWNTRINKLDGSINTGTWENKFAEMLLQCDDRQTHWETKFLDIAKTSEDLNPWETAFREIAPREEGEEAQWSSVFYAISEERDLPEHWETKFMDIEKNEYDENEWLIEMQDVPDNFRHPSDWTTGFFPIENHEGNALWDTLINGIVKDDPELTPWTTDFYETDVTDINREEWQTNINDILKNEIDELEWRVIVNPIENN